jgi:mRNA interferase HicA
VKQTEFVRWLKSQGVVLKNGKGHLKAYYNGKQTSVDRHPGKELTNQYVEVVKKQLGMK